MRVGAEDEPRPRARTRRLVRLAMSRHAAQVLCKPKLLPLKSVNLERLEEMEARMAELARQQAGSAPSSAHFA